MRPDFKPERGLKVAVIGEKGRAIASEKVQLDGKGQADKFLKGTIEIIRVIDANTSLCRLTSLYDARGDEIALNDPTRGRAAREVEAAIREGDLIFNMFWNARVAVAGIVNFTGFTLDAPSEQMRQLSAFGDVLQRQGIALAA